MQNPYFFYFYYFVQIYKGQGRYALGNPHITAVFGVSTMETLFIVGVQLWLYTVNDSYQAQLSKLPPILEFGWSFVLTVLINAMIFLREGVRAEIDSMFGLIPKGRRIAGYFLCTFVSIICVCTAIAGILNYEA